MRGLVSAIFEAYRFIMEYNLQHRSCPGWPRVLRAEQAANYVGMSRSMFDAEVKAGKLPKPFPTAGSLQAWDKNDLDDWVDARRDAAFATNVNEWDGP